jgi:hypothetical protein
MEAVRLSDIPQELLESISKQLSNYAVGFVRPEETTSSADLALLGSGTFVEINGVHGILTAHHVIEAFPNKGEIGLVLAPNLPTLHNPRIYIDFLTPVKVARGKVASEGPDLGIIVLPSVNLGSIKALKSFYNLGLRRRQVLSNPPANDMGMWFLCGFIDEFTIEDAPAKKYDRVKGFYCRCGPVLGVSKAYSVDGYDYFEFEVPYNEEHKFPKSYGGMSGGGVWQVELIRTPEGALAANALILSGVAFYESDVLDKKRSIKCHGRQSLYQAAVEAILSKGE